MITFGKAASNLHLTLLLYVLVYLSKYTSLSIACTVKSAAEPLCAFAAKKYSAFLASETVIKQIPRLLGPGLNKAGKFPALVSHAESLEGKVGPFCALTFVADLTSAYPISHTKVSNITKWLNNHECKYIKYTVMLAVYALHFCVLLYLRSHLGVQYSYNGTGNFGLATVLCCDCTFGLLLTSCSFLVCPF